jgi:hypothetical protein
MQDFCDYMLRTLNCDNKFADISLSKLYNAQRNAQVFYLFIYLILP